MDEHGSLASSRFTVPFSALSALGSMEEQEHVLWPSLSFQAFLNAVPPAPNVLFFFLHPLLSYSARMPSHFPQSPVVTPFSKPRYHLQDSRKEHERGRERQGGETVLTGSGCTARLQGAPLTTWSR